MSFKLKMLKGIIAFEITVSKLEASQNKKVNEREKIIASLKNSLHSTEKELAGYMNDEM